MALPIDKISSWSDEKLKSVISSGEKINWNIQMDEEDSEVECYVEMIYSEKEKRKI